MSGKDREPSTEQEARRRVKEYLKERREQYPVPPVSDDEPTGLLNGKPEHFLNIYEEDEDLSPEEIRQRYKIYDNGVTQKYKK